MSKFKDKLSMFESANKPPPMKPKPAFKWVEPNIKRQSRTINSEQVTETSGELSLAKDLNEDKNSNEEGIIDVTIEVLNETKREEEPSSASMTECEYAEFADDVVVYYEPLEVEEQQIIDHEPDDVDDGAKNLTFDFKDSQYDLPGLENFKLNSEPIRAAHSDEKSSPDTNQFQIELYHDSTDEDDQCAVSPENKSMANIELAPSRYLIEEIVNTNNLRDSSSFSDDVISISTFSNASGTNSKRQSIISEEEAVKNHVHRKRNFLSNIFPRKPKKMPEPVTAKNKVSFQESSSKSITKVMSHDNTEEHQSVEQNSKKPLNAILNRDWLNSLGDGIRKKATVMSELKKMFNRGKLIGNQEKLPKQNIDGIMEKQQTKVAGGEMHDENNSDAFDDKIKKLKAQNSKSRISINNCEMKNNKSKKPVTKIDNKKKKAPSSKDKVMATAKHFQQNDHDSDIIYDEEFDDDEIEYCHKPKKIDVVHIPDVQAPSREGSVPIDDIVYDNEEEVDDVVEALVRKSDKDKGGQRIESRNTEVYDQDEDIVEVYELDDDEEDIKNTDQSKIKTNVKDVSNTRQPCNKVQPDNSKSTKQNIRINTEIYDEDPDIIEVYDYDDGDNSVSNEDNKKTSKQWDNSNKSDKEVRNIDRGVKKVTSKHVEKKNEKKVVHDQSEIYDEDDIEEYVSDDSIYDNDAVQDDEEDAHVNEKIGGTRQQDIQAVDEEEYDGDEMSGSNVDIEIYEDDEDLENGAAKVVKKKPPKNKIDKQKKSVTEGESKVSLTTRLRNEIKRRRDNMRENLKLLEQTKTVVPDKKHVEIKVAPCDNTKEMEEILTVIKDIEATEDDALKKHIKKNLDRAKKTFKLKDPIKTLAIGRALKTSFVESKIHLQFNIGEILDVLEYRNDLLLVRNAVGKCGLTQKINVQIIKSDP